MAPQTEGIHIVGLTGRARVGKDTVADYLVEAYGFERRAFARGVKEEVAAAFPGAELDPADKESPQTILALGNCTDPGFVEAAKWCTPSVAHGDPRSYRVIWQLWGTEYRRAQDQNYWVGRADAWLVEQLAAGHRRFVFTDVRFENERQWITSFREHGARTDVWHVQRADAPTVAAHASEAGLELMTGETLLLNNAGIEDLRTGVTLALQGNQIVNTRKA